MTIPQTRPSREATIELVEAAATLVGDTPPDNAYRYDLLLESVLRPLSDEDLVHERRLQGIRVDFYIAFKGRGLWVESKFSPPGSPRFRGRTLDPLLQVFAGSDEKLLVVTNAVDPRPAKQMVKDQLGTRGDVVSWSGTLEDVDILTAHVRRLLDDSR